MIITTSEVSQINLALASAKSGVIKMAKSALQVGGGGLVDAATATAFASATLNSSNVLKVGPLEVSHATQNRKMPDGRDIPLQTKEMEVIRRITFKTANGVEATVKARPNVVCALQAGESVTFGTGAMTGQEGKFWITPLTAFEPTPEQLEASISETV